MGVKIAELVEAKEISIDDLKSKKVTLDSFLFLYQFLSSIRQPDGSYLTDSKGNVTSHLIGLFSRTLKLMTKQIYPIFVFDGKPPELKQKERERRRSLKEEAQKEYEIAKQRKDLKEMKKFASRTTRLTKEMVDEAKELIEALGLPIVQAPCEGEAQASHIVYQGDAYAVATQDADALMFKAPKVVKNLSFFGKKKKSNKLSYETIKPQIITFEETLNKLGVDHNQFVALCMLIGTDYNVGGIKGIGSKTALKLVKKFGHDFESLFSEAKWDDFFDFSWRNVMDLILNMEVTDDYKIEFGQIDKTRILKILVENHDFSRERVEEQLDKVIKETSNMSQKGLSEFF